MKPEAASASCLDRIIFQVVILPCALMCPAASAQTPVAGWAESATPHAFTVKRGHVVLQGQSRQQVELHACDTVQLKNRLASVRITLSDFQKVLLDASVAGGEIKIPCSGTAHWGEKALALVKIIAGTATSPISQDSHDSGEDREKIAASRSADKTPRLTVPALGNYAPLLVAGERALYVTWEGGVAPYTVTLQRYGGNTLFEKRDIRTTEVRLPDMRLAPGRYVLLVQGSDKYAIKEDGITVVEASRLPAAPKALADAQLSNADYQLLYAYFLEGWGKGEWTLESLQRAAAIRPPTPQARDWLRYRFSQRQSQP